MLWAMCSQWDQGPCWNWRLVPFVLCYVTVICSRLVSWGLELLWRTFHLYSGPKVQTKQYLGRQHIESHCKPFSFCWNTRQTLFFLDCGQFWLSFFFNFTAVIYDSLLYTIFYGSVKIHRKRSDFSGVLTPCLLCIEIKSVEYNSMG